MLKFKTSCAVLAYLSSSLLNEVGLSLFRYFEVGLRVCDIVVNKFTFAISSPDEFLYEHSCHTTPPITSIYKWKTETETEWGMRQTGAHQYGRRIRVVYVAIYGCCSCRIIKFCPRCFVRAPVVRYQTSTMNVLV